MARDIHEQTVMSSSHTHALVFAIARNNRHDDIALLDVFSTASEYVKLSVMDYAPFYLYSSLPTLWPDLDNGIRLAALRGVKISFIVALWNHTCKKRVRLLVVARVARDLSLKR